MFLSMYSSTLSLIFFTIILSICHLNINGVAADVAVPVAVSSGSSSISVSASAPVSSSSSWFDALHITSIGESKVTISSDYAIVVATIQTQQPFTDTKQTSFASISPVTSISPRVRVEAVDATPDTTGTNETVVIQAVQQATATKAETTVAYLNKQAKQVWKVETSAVQLYPDYVYDQNPPRIVGYRASVTLSFRVSIARAGVVLDGITGAGVSLIQGISYGCEQDKISAAESRAVTEAVTNAKERAQAALTGTQHTNKQTQPQKSKDPVLTVKSIDILSVGGITPYPSPYPYPPIAYDRAVSSGPSVPANTPVLPPEQTITASVSAKFEVNKN